MTVVKHKSGLTVYYVKKDFAASYAIFGTKYGSFDNEFTVDGQRITVPHGIAHFLEHKLFETEDGTDTFELFSELGADANAYTSTDRTAYLFSCTENFYQSLEVLVKMVLTPVFTEKNVSKEMGIIGQEIKMCEDRTRTVLYYNLMKALYEHNPIRIPIAGTLESIAKITPELLYKCYNSFYRMSNMALCICTNEELDGVIEILDRYLPEDCKEQVLHADSYDGDAVYKQVVAARAEIARPLFEIGLKIPRANPSDACALEIICEAVLGESEDFYNDCFEDELFTSYHQYCDCSRVGYSIQLGGDSDSPSLVLERFRDLAAKVRENGISREAFERAKRSAYADALRAFDGSENVAEELFEAFLSGESYLDCVDRYKAVTYEKADALARQIFNDEAIGMSVIYPNGSLSEEEDDE